jgi:hypothetical protein
VSFPAGCGVALLGVDHGDDTLGGFGSYVNIDAILSSRDEFCSQPFGCRHIYMAFERVRKENVLVCE